MTPPQAPMASPPQYPFNPPIAIGAALELRPGLLWLRLPMPFALDHVNVWAIDDGDAGWTVVDTGLWAPPTLAAWEAHLSAGGALGGRPVSRVISTHMHSDHVGLAGWFAQRFGSPLWMTRLEFLHGRVAIADAHRQAPAEWDAFLRRAGWTPDEIDAWRPLFGRYSKLMHPLPEGFRPIVDREVLQIGGHEWEVIVGRGHSPEHACLYCASLDVLISGDQILPRITSNVSVHPFEPDADPMADWLDSIAHLHTRVPDNVLVLPAHNEPFIGLHARLDELEDSALQALDRLRALLDEPQRVVDVFGALFKRRVDGDTALRGLATGEGIANLNHLVGRGEAVVDTGPDGVAWFRKARAAAC